MSTRLAAVALAFVALMISCGGSEAPRLSPRARVELEAEVDAAKAAAAAHDVDGARRALAATIAGAEALEHEGRISHVQAKAIHDAAIRVEGLLALVTTTSTTPSPASEAGDENGKSPGNGKDRGKGHGKK